MHHEFEQLLEAQWSGRLDDAGQRRLSELCAADPARAERYHAEQRLSGLLAQCGPNHAPPDLAGRIMARLDTRIRVRPANSPANPWYAWVFQPALRTALAAMVLVAVGVEGGLLIADWRNRPAEQATADGPFIPPELRAPESSLPAVPAAGIRTDGDRQAAPRKGSHTPGRGNATVRPRPNPAQIAMAIPTSEFPAVSGPGLSSNDRILPGPSTNSPAAMPKTARRFGSGRWVRACRPAGPAAPEPSRAAAPRADDRERGGNGEARGAGRP